MTSGAHGVLGQIQRLFTEGTVAGLTEWQLLQRYVGARDDVAFRALMARHGPMVLGVCRRMLIDPRDVEDAFQATFLVLLHKAGSIDPPQLVGNFLYGVAYHTSRRARVETARRHVKENEARAMARPESEEKVEE